MNNNSQAIHIKKEILVRIIKAFLSDNFEKNTRLIPYDMRPKGTEVPYRCCVYKERAIIKDRTIAGLGFAIEEDNEKTLLSEYAKMALDRNEIDNKNLTVLQAACKGCSTNRIYVTDLCQGCIARPCEKTCKFGAISVKNGRAKIDPTKCKNCKMCIAACPYNAIVKIAVPCEDACPVGAITKNEQGLAEIDFEQCISCGRCVASCPFGAIHERSQIIDVLKHLESNESKVVALFAPAIVGQFPGTIGQLKQAILQSGFDDVFEVAQGADITTRNESEEFHERIEKGEPFMTTSCCAGYNQLVKKHLPEIKPFVSDTKTPLYYTAEIAHEKYPDAKLVFISPCVAKRTEVFENPILDYTLSAEELGALFIAKKIQLIECDEIKEEHEPSKQARNYCLTGGVAEAVTFASNDKEIIKPYIINGLSKEAIRDLKKFANSKSCPDCNLIEVMACPGGCIGGNTTINTIKGAKKIIDNLANNSKDMEE